MKIDLKGLWVVEWHPRGAFTTLPVEEVVERNFKQCMADEQTLHTMLGLFPSLESAREGIRILKRRKWQKNEDDKTKEECDEN